MFYILTESRALEPYKPGPLIKRIGASEAAAATQPIRAHEAHESSQAHTDSSRQKQMAKAYEEQLEDASASHPLVVEAIMSRPAQTFLETALIKDAVETMKTNGFKNFPIISGDGRLVGMLSDRDLLSSTKTRVNEVMQRRVISVNPQAPIRQLVAIMLQEKIPCVPVVKTDLQVVGIVTTTDILKAFLTHSPAEFWIRNLRV